MSKGERNPNHFPSTSWDLLADIRIGGTSSGSALDTFSRRYYEPARRYLRQLCRGTASDDEASDLAQSFFSDKVLNGYLFKRADQEKGAFRVYLKASLRNYVHDSLRRRTGDPLAGSADVTEMEIASPAEAAAEQEFDHAWLLSLVSQATPIVKANAYAKGQGQHYEIFRRRHLLSLENDNDPPTWKQVGAAYGVSEKDAANQAETMRRAFCQTVFDLVVQETGSEQAAKAELGSLRIVAGKASSPRPQRKTPPPLAELLAAAD